MSKLDLTKYGILNADLASAIAFLLIGICNIIEIAYLCSSVICLLICNFFSLDGQLKQR